MRRRDDPGLLFNVTDVGGTNPLITALTAWVSAGNV